MSGPLSSVQLLIRGRESRAIFSILYEVFFREQEGNSVATRLLGLWVGKSRIQLGINL